MKKSAALVSRWVVSVLVSLALNSTCRSATSDQTANQFFEAKIRPVLVDRCITCHSVKKHKGGLALDTFEGLRKGGDTGPSVIPGNASQSLLIQSIRHVDPELKMPKNTAKLDDATIADFARWVDMGAPFPVKPVVVKAEPTWEERFQKRRMIWSLQPLRRSPLPQVKNAGWCREELDRFILDRLEAEGLAPATEADRGILLRRLSFALTGLPPDPREVVQFLKDASPKAYDSLVDRLLASPHFGEHWARHWMDLVHYADTHGYEWDTPAKGAWLYRDYLIRAFNADVSYQQLVREHLAGDLLERSRINLATGLNESLLATASLRLGERRHGDSAEFEGIHQEAIDNVIDTVSKVFLATTVACSRCHDHKLDAISQKDYYALEGIFMSSRWVCRVVDIGNPNAGVIPELKRIKSDLRPALAELWLRESASLGQTLAKASADIPKESPVYAWAQLTAALKRGDKVADAWSKLRNEYANTARQRAEADARNVHLIADFTQGKMPSGWQAEGYGLRDGFVNDGEIVLAEEGPDVVRAILPAGLYTFAYSSRLNGALRSPLLTADMPFVTLQAMAGGLASWQVVVDNALFPESRYRFLDLPVTGPVTVSTLPDDIKRGRRVFVELNTKLLNNYYPPRVGLVATYSPQQQDDPRSWFGVTRVYTHASPAQTPHDRLGRFQRLFAGKNPSTLEEASSRFSGWSREALERWKEGRADAEDAILIDGLVRYKLLSNHADASTAVGKLVREYRTVEARLRPEHVVGAVADLGEGRDDRIAVRGSYTDLAESVPRGNIRLLANGNGFRTSASGRLELANAIASKDNPLTARVFVNRVWHYLFGDGLVATVDDFGHLGEKPSHPELLDHLATRFMEEGWSVKKLVRMMVMSATWRQSDVTHPKAMHEDPANRWWHHYPLRRLEAEAVRDAVLAASGRLDSTLYGPPIDPYRRSVDKEKRLFSGPLDGNGRRSLYTKMTLMEPPKFLSLFNQPIPKLTVGRRDVTNVPDQALALLNDPFVTGQADFWAGRLLFDGSSSVEARVDGMILTALGRPAETAERERFCKGVEQLAKLRQLKGEEVLKNRDVWKDVAHTVFNLKEFIYIR